VVLKRAPILASHPSKPVFGGLAFSALIMRAPLSPKLG
jgi:hypothetical protein